MRQATATLLNLPCIVDHYLTVRHPSDWQQTDKQQRQEQWQALQLLYPQGMCLCGYSIAWNEMNQVITKPAALANIVASIFPDKVRQRTIQDALVEQTGVYEGGQYHSSKAH
jgi:hypothetical protein